MVNKAKILLFNIETTKTKQIESICRNLHIQTVKVRPSSYGQTLGYLAGISGFNRRNAPYNGPEFPSEMLVFCGMDSDLVDAFLDAYKKASIPPIGLKAIVTPHNIFWTAESLYKELLKEHTTFRP